ncbi:hypothetical protein, partial [Pseudomonas syringae]|uniref:hypothetical protein n=1 Tax=Pseudomonas syringae TaxID=317 RepID=UPI0011AF1A3F
MQNETLTQIPLGNVSASECEVRAFINLLLKPSSGNANALQQAAKEWVDGLIKQFPDVEQKLKDTLIGLLRVLMKMAHGLVKDPHLIASGLSASIRQELQSTDYEYINSPDDAFRHGRVRQETLVMGGLSTTTDY